MAKSSKEKKITITLDGILSDIMASLCKSKPEEVDVYLEKAAWLYRNVPKDFFTERKR